jgi:uncharacterized protein YegP (UPF0339 family)
MKNKLPVLEYSQAEGGFGEKGGWSFTFRTAEGEVLVQSPASFETRADAERGFLFLIKSVARNQYRVEFPRRRAPRSRSLRFSRACYTFGKRGRSRPSIWVAASTHESRIG